ncbi:sulfate ABC transporter permease subunit CysT [Ketogulonicigenium vulgare]|uniref:Sulfate transport system permease protein CysT n=1 Tax=Ketogulonicigenium vulgare (strain WSH-001) TaxID=759362 RepID=F9Y6S9_KETVW|nr:sulfate ABC transporter permease subunit CysT [Ketogulonicigenium vulgare]ADO42759.1 sulfate ABC transporter, inner membrane subunit CysT [Ketogulonicigenium vulgare Y25]AEM40946.1 Sulfate ABC transporter, permease protein CysT [Ketogulonicigenium vulgare WSH-001]ALJ81099.1 sulfate/thiosulfate transporter subunit [Ketogulonicigenium vulgare]ANW33849.1 sulfate ABC transporter permease subunit CysT [Ketogulonicigenium vulgare]AOZ54671.1 sulfate ABC transporter inner membrane protein CysT [Ket
MIAHAKPIRRKNVLPGLSLSLGTTLLYVALIVMLPVVALVLKGASIGPDRFWTIMTSPRTLAAFKITLIAASVATVINALYGLLMAWVLVRYEFPGKRILDALMDVPFALPTAVAGLSLTALFSANGWFGGLLDAMGIQVVYTLWGIIIAMTFTSIPFVVRTVQPVLEDLDPGLEQAAVTLGASPFTVFRRIILPAILPAWLAGATVSFARSLGEFGAVVFIAGNIPMKTEIASLLAFIRLAEYDYNGAAVIALALLVIALVLLVVSNLLQAWASRYREATR